MRGCVQILTGQPVAAVTDAVRDQTSTVIPAATPDLATAELLAAAFPDQLASAKEFGDARAGTAPRQLAAETVGTVIRSAARGKASGPSGLRMEPIWVLSSAGPDALVRDVQLLAPGDGVDKVLSVARRALGAATLLLLVKPGGADAAGVPGLRPIGMPETIRKLGGRALMREVLPDARRCSLPLQRAIGVSGACEDLVHEADARLAAEPTWGALQLDFKDAFHRISIQAAMSVAQAPFPELVFYLRCIYLGEPPPVYGWGVEDGHGGLPARLVWRVERGTQKGDVLGSLMHALALHPALQAIAASHERCTVLGLHDDRYVIVPVDELAAVMHSASELGAEVDAELAPAKCAAWSPTPRAPPSDLASQWRTDRLTFFGIQVGGDAFVTAEVDKMAAAHEKMVRAVVSLPPDAVQAQLLPLRMCASPLNTYTLRCLPPAAAKVLAARVDATVRRKLLGLFRAENDRRETRKTLLSRAALPVRMGGLKLGGRSVIVPAAHNASRLAALPSADVSAPALQELARALPAAPAVPAARALAGGAARPATADAGGGPSPAEWRGTSGWPGSAATAVAAAPSPLAPPLAAAPLGTELPASLAAFAAEGGLWGPLLPRLQACLDARAANATFSTEGSFGASPFESVDPPSTDPLLSLPPPLYTANVPAAGLPRALAGDPCTWRDLMAALTRLTQPQLAAAAHVAAARVLWAPLSMSARARWAACCGHASG